MRYARIVALIALLLDGALGFAETVRTLYGGGTVTSLLPSSRNSYDHNPMTNRMAHEEKESSTTARATGTLASDDGVSNELRIASYQLVDYLERVGVDVVFGLCGHTVIALLDALGKSRVRFISTRHEQVAAHAADGYARASGKPGVLLTHLGPGLTNATTGVANAALDSVPLVVIAGDIPSYFYGRHPHQEVNLHKDADQFDIYRPFCKRVYRVDRVADLPRIVERAFHLCKTGRPGPVLIDVPMDVLSADLPVGSFQKVPPAIAPAAIDPAAASRIVETLATAERPIIYAGGGVISSHATRELASLAEALEIPVAHTLMGKGCLPDGHPLLLGQTGFWGVPIANEMCRTADLILAVGTRLAEANSSSWNTNFTFSIPPTRLIHIDIDPAELGRNYPTELGVVADAKSALASLATAAQGKSHRSRAGLRQKIADGLASFASNWKSEWDSDQFPLRPERILGELRKAVPEDGFIVTDVGWNKNGVAQQFRFTVPGTFITPSGLATMGFGPAAVLGVKVAQPKRAAVALIGDGAFSSNMSVVATAMEAGIPAVWVVMDNCAYGTIAGLEEMHYGWSFGCLFESEGKPYSVDYAAVARASGARGIAIKSAGELGPALKEALASNLPTVIQVPMENAPTPTPGHWDINDIYRKGQ
ncbi:MAG TPA: thiamine pyrophosphate-binding protein [Candidatus Aquilonibacter sp.]|nr:thiamine pyrophosphate-binding protein [Candidatus Aquilonibacter sp.]